MSLEKARAEIVGLLQTLPGLKQVPDGVPEKAQFPFAVVFADNGELYFFNDAQMLGLHNITVQIHVIREPDLERHYNELEPFITEIPKQLKAKLKTREWDTIQTWERIEYTVQGSRWGGINTLAINFTLRNTKIITNYD